MFIAQTDGRPEIARRIFDAHTPRRGKVPPRFEGRYVLTADRHGHAVCLWWDGWEGPPLDRDGLFAIFQEARALRLTAPLTVYGVVSVMQDNASFRFLQLQRLSEGTHDD